MIVAGDFNTFWGEHEMSLFMEASGLRSANVAGLPGIVDAAYAMPDAHWGYGFPIGGVPPIGLATPVREFLDEDLLGHDIVWAAAGTWHDVFGIEPHKLVEASEGLVTDLKRG